MISKLKWERAPIVVKYTPIVSIFFLFVHLSILYVFAHLLGLGEIIIL